MIKDNAKIVLRFYILVLLNVELTFYCKILAHTQIPANFCMCLLQIKNILKIDHKIRTIVATMELRRKERKNDGLLFV